MVKKIASKLKKVLPGTRCERRQLIILAALAATAFLLTGCSSLKNLPPEQALNKALLGTVAAKSFVADLTLNNPLILDLPSTITPVAKNVSVVELTIKNDQRKKNKSATALLLKTYKRAQKQPTLALDLFANNSNFYFAINKLPAALKKGLGSLAGQTYQLPLADIAGLLPQRLSNRLSLTQTIDPKTFSKTLKAHPDLFKDIKELNAEEIAGETARRFAVKLNKSAAKEVLKDLNAHQKDGENGGAKIKWPDHFFNKRFEIWIGLKSKRIVRVKTWIPENVRLSKTAFRFDLKLGRFNDDLGLTPPTDAQRVNLLELMSKLGSGELVPDDGNTDNNNGADTNTANSEEPSGTPGSGSAQGQNNLDVGNATLPGLPQVEFPVQ